MNVKILGITLLLVGLWLFLAVQVPEGFLNGNNMFNLFLRTAMYGVLGIGVAFVIITSGIDLSIGSIVCLSGVLLTFSFGQLPSCGWGESLCHRPSTTGCRSC